MFYEGTPVIEDMVDWWRNELENASAAELPQVLDNLMAERYQFNPETTEVLEQLHEEFSTKLPKAA